MLLTRSFAAKCLAFLAPLGFLACLRFVDTPDPWPCTVDDDCQDGRVCMANACVPVACTKESQASCAPYLCKSNACLTSCSSASDCDSEHECEVEKCVPKR